MGLNGTKSVLEACVWDEWEDWCRGEAGMNCGLLYEVASKNVCV